MTILSRAVRDLLERLLGRFHEGPDMPPRIAEEARLFRALATQTPTEEEWEAFAVRLAEHAYEQGFVRGLHWLERSWDGPVVDPEKLLEIEAHNQSLKADPHWAAVLEQPMRAREFARVQEQIAEAAMMGHSVILEERPRHTPK